MKYFKRVYRYVKDYKKYFIISLVMIFIVQILGFLSPLIVKAVLDDYILGIEYEWKEIAVDSEKAVVYNGKYYKQVRYLEVDDEIVGDASIILYKDGFYFTNEIIEKGNKSLKDNVLTIKSKDGLLYNYQVNKLDAKTVVNFYKPMFNALVILILLLFARSIISIIASYIQRICADTVIVHIARNARTDAMKSIERLPIKYFESEPSGKMSARISIDVNGLIGLYRIFVNVLTSAVLSFVFAYVGMFYLDYRLALISFVIYPLVYIWIKFFLKRLKKVAVKVNELRSMMVAKINEIINGINILQIFNYKKQTVSEFNNINNDFTKEQLKEVKLHITYGWNMIGIVKAIVTVMIVVYFGYQYLTVSEIIVTAGLIYAYNEYLLKIIEPVNIIFTQVGEFQHALVQTDRIFKIIDGDLEDNTISEVDRYQGNIKFDDIWFAYNEKEYVLKGISFEIEKGQTVGLVGHTGSGKSSLMNLLLRFYDLSDENSGSIYLDDVNINTFSKKTYRKHIGIVLQEPVLFKGTIASNIRFGKDGVTDEEIEDVLISLGGEKLLMKFPEGINTPITRAGLNMSSGEKQIISLARAFIYNPAILIMDEATSHIDTETEEMIKNALDIVSKNRTTIIIAHRLSTIKNADKIIVLDHGLKVEEGKHNDLIEKNGVYANIYRSQVV